MQCGDSVPFSASDEKIEYDNEDIQSLEL